MRLMRRLLLCTTLIVSPTLASAEPVSAFFIGLSGGTLAAASSVGASFFAAGTIIGTFFSGTLGSLLLTAGLSYLTRPRIQTPDIERAQVVSRNPSASRRQAAGYAKVGGDTGCFIEEDGDGAFWYVTVHCDAEMVGDAQYFLDGIPVTIADVYEYVQIVSIADVDLVTPPTSIGSVAVADGDRVFLTGQTDAVENGIYDAAVSGGVVTLTRSADMPAGSVIGKAVSITTGEYDELPVVLPFPITSSDMVVFHPDSDGLVVGTDELSFSSLPYYHGIETGDVITNTFCHDDDKDIYEGSGQKRTPYRIYTVTPTAAQIYGDKPAAFTSAFPELPADWFLAGVTYSIVRVGATSTYGRQVTYRWNGPIGKGEPAVQLYANWGRLYDPRNEDHDLEDPGTWTASDGNPAIIWAWWRMNQFGRNQSSDLINWDEVAAAADICDILKQDRSGDWAPNYRCGFVGDDATERYLCEQEILLTMDAFVAYDDQGRAYPVPGHYEAPTLTFTRERDILTAQTKTINDGEQPMDGVVVRYVSPDHDYTKQECAPWKNPDFYDASRAPNYLYRDILGCQNHRQAVQLAKAIGGREQAKHRASLGTTVKGILAKRERSIDLAYDAVFTGDHEIVGPVKEEPNGFACALTVVPLSSERWTLLEGEEGAPPAPAPALEIDNDLPDPSNVVITSESVATSAGQAVRMRADFGAYGREDAEIRIRYAPTGTYDYEYFTINMDELFGYSALVPDGETFDVWWKTIVDDRGTSWSDAYAFTVEANPTAPSDLVSASATGGSGEAVLAWTTANDANQYAVRVYRSATTTFGDGSLISTVITPANTEGGATDSGLIAGTYYYWLVPTNGSGVENLVEATYYTAVVT